MGRRFRQLTQTASDADFVEGNYFGVSTPNVDKKVPANLIAKASEQTALKKVVSEISVPSINLFNVDSADNSIDKFVFSDGTLTDNSNYNSSGYIPVTAGQTYTFSAKARSVCFYNGTNYVAWSANVSTITVPSGANALRFCATKARWNDNYMLVEGSSLPDYYVKGGMVIDEDRIPPPNIPDNYISIEQVSFSEPSINLFNINDSNVALGKYLNNGTLTDNSNYNSSGYIPVTAGQTYTFSAQARFVEYYNGTSYVSNEQYKTSVTIPNNCNALRFSTAVSNWSEYMVVHGDELPAKYVPFGQILSESVLPKTDTYLQDIIGGKAAVTSMGGGAKIATYASVSSSDTLQLTDVPKDPKNGLFFSCGFKFSVFTSLKIGKGYNAYRGAWIEVDGTNIVCKTYEQSVTTIDTVAHGLVLSSYMRLSVTTDKQSRWNVTLNSEGGTFTTSFQLAFEFCGTAFASFGSAATSVKLAFGDSTYKSPVWLFGDSYVGISNPARWPYYLNEQGYLNIMMNGLAGRGSSAALEDFERALAFGCPKYVIWCMGMNDTDSVWLNNYKQVKRLCEQNGIELILTTIPTTPTQNKETITEYVRNSGLRYIDFYAAVGTNSNGEWYSGMLSSDNVHPTRLGAKALAAQVLVDFPEIVQFEVLWGGLGINADKMRVIAEALVNLDSRLKAAEKSISSVNIGSRIADELDTQSLNVGGEDINTDRSDSVNFREV